MTRFITICLLLIFSMCKLYAQAPASIVNDPKANATLSILETLQKTVIDISKKTKDATENLSNYQKLRNTAADVVTTLATVKKIQELLVDLSCQMEELKTSVAIVDNMNNCVFKLDYNLMLMKLQGATDLIKVALVGGNAVLQLGEKTDMLTKVMATLENSIKDMKMINKQINLAAMEMLRERYNNRISYSGSISNQR